MVDVVASSDPKCRTRLALFGGIVFLFDDTNFVQIATKFLTGNGV